MNWFSARCVDEDERRPDERLVIVELSNGSFAYFTEEDLEA